MRMDDFLKCDLSIILICSTPSTILGFLFLGFFVFFFFSGWGGKEDDRGRIKTRERKNDISFV